MNSLVMPLKSPFEKLEAWISRVDYGCTRKQRVVVKMGRLDQQSRSMSVNYPNEGVPYRPRQRRTVSSEHHPLPVMCGDRQEPQRNGRPSIVPKR